MRLSLKKWIRPGLYGDLAFYVQSKRYEFLFRPIDRGTVRGGSVVWNTELKWVADDELAIRMKW